MIWLLCLMFFFAEHFQCHLETSILEVYAIKNCWVWVLKLVGSATHSHIRTHLKGDDIFQIHVCHKTRLFSYIIYDLACMKFQSFPHILCVCV